MWSSRPSTTTVSACGTPRPRISRAPNTPAGRDLIREYVDAVRAEGLKVGLYYSIIDWYHEDFPHYGDRNHPMRNHPECGNEHRDFNRYLAYMHEQVRELCSNYGKLDILWFDFSYDNLRGEAWKATQLVEMVRSLQPEVIIDNRLEVSGEGYGSLASGNPTPYHGGFRQPGADDSPGGHPGRQRPAHSLGGLRHHEQSLGLLRHGYGVQARLHAH